MTITELLNAEHPVRKSWAQKSEFCAWFIAWAKEQGYDAREESKGFNTNVVVGDPETAKVLVTAHYDTPPVMPVPNFITPCNVPMFLLYQVGMVALIFLAVAGVAALTGYLSKDAAAARFSARVGAWVIFGLLMFGPANRHNVNDNSSGVAAVMETMTRLPEDARGKVCFVLFDNEEKGMLGSARFASLHKRVKKETLVVNLDCVGDGENVLLLGNKRTRALPQWPLLTAAMYAQTGRTLVLQDMEKAIYPSDQANFKLGAAMCACKKARVIGYYCDKIHTRHDKTCEQANMDFIAGGLTQFIERL